MLIANQMNESVRSVQRTDLTDKVSYCYLEQTGDMAVFVYIDVFGGRFIR